MKELYSVLRWNKNEIYGLIYAGIAIAVAFYVAVYVDMGSSNSDTGAVPTVGRFNASDVIRARQLEIQTSFEEVLNQKGWITLKQTERVSIQRMDLPDGSWPPYVKTTAFLHGTPEQVQDRFTWNNFHETQRAIDPFFEDAESLFEVSSNTRIIRKTTKRPLIYPKREFTMALVQGEQKNKVTVRNSMDFGVGFISRKTPTTSLITVTPTDQVAATSSGAVSSSSSSSSYVHSFQDFVAWYRPRINYRTEEVMEGWTELTIVMRVDLGRDIPHWAFMLLVGHTGVGSMKLLQDHIRRLEQKRNV